MDKLQGKRVGLEQTLIKLCIWYVYGLIPILKRVFEEIHDRSLK